MYSTLLEVRNLTTTFSAQKRRVVAVQGVNFAVRKSSTVAIVGESGCGKTVTALSILRLIQAPPGRIESGQVLLDGTDLMLLDEKSIRAVRGNRVSMIFQEPMTSLNPVFTVGAQIAEGLILHRNMRRRDARLRAVELLSAVGIPSAERRIDSYPHQLSGGMQQRVMIAMALACSPELLIADEPTTALDVTIQAQILDLISKLQDEFSMSVLLITHDLGIVAQHADEVIVMYAGRVVESAAVVDLFESPLHPYTAGLLASIPAHALTSAKDSRPKRLPTIEGLVPGPDQVVNGCKFAERCARRLELGPVAKRCEQEEPDIRDFGGNRSVRCHFPLEGPSATN
jgi:oligopeptide/dipeptide ABC transporter ATP-binding protein